MRSCALVVISRQTADKTGKRVRHDAAFFTSSVSPSFFLCSSALLSVVPVIRELQVRLIDTLFQWVPLPKQRFRVVVVLIEDDSLQKLWAMAMVSRVTRPVDR